LQLEEMDLSLVKDRKKSDNALPAVAPKATNDFRTICDGG